MKATFMHIKRGSNVIRIVTKAYQYVTHDNCYLSKPHKQKLKCPYPYAGKSTQCTLCQDGDPVTLRWIAGVIDYRNNQSCRLIDIGEEQFKQIQKYANHKIWGDPSGYDLSFYLDDFNCELTISARPPYPLNASQKLQIQDQISIDELLVMTVPNDEETRQAVANRTYNKILQSPLPR